LPSKIEFKYKLNRSLARVKKDEINFMLDDERKYFPKNKQTSPLDIFLKDILLEKKTMTFEYQNFLINKIFP